MPEVMGAIRNRRSIRKFEAREVPDDLINGLMEAVRWSPSWANTQCWEVVVIRDEGVKRKLQDTIGPKNPATKAVVQAPVLLALCGRLKTSGYYQDRVTTKFGDWFMYDLGIATQSLCLAAHAAGLGTVIVGLFDHDRAAAILEIPGGLELVSLIPLGYPAHSPPGPARRRPGEFVHWDRF